MTESELRASVLRLFPAAGPRVTVELGSGGEWAIDVRRDGLWAVIRIVVHDDHASHIVREEPLCLLPDRHLTERGVAFLAFVTTRAANLPAADLERAIPRELFDPTILDVPGLPVEDFGAALADPRTRQIFAVRRWDPELLATIDPRKVVGPTLVNAELEDRIVERLDDDAASRDMFAVYGDWLSERGDPRGEFVAIQLALETAPDDMALVARERALLVDHTFEWLRELAWLPANQVGVTWRRGFAHTIRFGYGIYDWRGGAPSTLGARVDLARLGRMPNTRFVRRVEFLHKELDDVELFETIGELGLPPSTVELAIATDRTEVCDLTPAYPALAKLRALRVDARAVELGLVRLPELRRLELLLRGTTRANVTALRAASWPHLERLELWIADDDIGYDLELADLDWILAGTGLPKLRELALCGRSAPTLLERLRDAKIVRRLDVLDVCGGYISNEGIAWLQRNAAAFAHLRALHLPGIDSEEAAKIGAFVVIDERSLTTYND